VLLVFDAPCQLCLLAGQEHGRTIPILQVSDIHWPGNPPLVRPLSLQLVMEPRASSKECHVCNAICDGGLFLLPASRLAA
jgi:hypothetical protein